MLLSSAIEGFLTDKSISLSTSTIATYTYWLDRFVSFLDDPEVESIRPIDVRRWFAHLLDECKLSRRSVADAWVPLRSLWTWAEVELEIPHIMRRVERVKFHDKPVEPFTKDELKRLVAGARHSEYIRQDKQVKMKRSTGNRDVAIIMVLVDSGLRVSELCSLTVGDYDSDRGRLHVRQGKGDKDRFVYVGNATRKALWRMNVGREVEPDDPLFATNTGEHLARNNVHKLLKRIGERVGVPNVYPHRFRHTYAITFLRNGASVAEVKESLGHTTLDMTLRYARIAEIDLEKAGKSYSPADNWKLK